MQNVKMTIRPDNTVRFHGIEHHQATVHHMYPNGHLVIKIKGGMTWASRGSQVYSGADFYVYQITEIEQNGDNVTVKADKITDFPVRSDYAKAPHYVNDRLKGMQPRFPIVTK
jgi:hypothetical protein